MVLNGMTLVELYDPQNQLTHSWSILFSLILTEFFFSALGRPTLFPLPGFVAKAIFGEFGDEVLLGE